MIYDPCRVGSLESERGVDERAVGGWIDGLCAPAQLLCTLEIGSRVRGRQHSVSNAVVTE